MRLSSSFLLFLAALSCGCATEPLNSGNPVDDAARQTPLLERVEHLYTHNGEHRIHYAALGEGPLVVMIHGFPDYWYSWRTQMQALASGYRVAAIDNRGYNLSGQPEGVDAYTMPKLVDDVAAVIAAEGAANAVVVGHDWGAMIAWWLAITRPKLVSNLVILNVPHPNGLAREIANNPTQRANSAYAFEFQKEGAHKRLSAERLARWVEDPQANALYVAAFQRSSFEGMLNYYKANYPKPDDEPNLEQQRAQPKVQAPVLVFHGMDDAALLTEGHDGMWQWLEKDATLVTIPGANHFVHHDASELVTQTMLSWISQRLAPMVSD